jgi:hypothetical protein
MAASRRYRPAGVRKHPPFADGLANVPNRLNVEVRRVQKIKQTVRKLRDLGIERRKERAGRNFGRFRPDWPSDAT